MIKRALLFGSIGLLLCLIAFSWYDATYFGGRLASNVLMSCRDMSDSEARAYAHQKIRESRGGTFGDNLAVEITRRDSGTSDEHFEAAFVDGGLRVGMIRVFADCETEYFDGAR
jgi:hypothetical protein